MLRQAILDYVAAARSSPADAIGGALTRLQQSASDSAGGVADSVALVQRVANSTWMSRVQMDPAVLESNGDTIDIPYPCTIVSAMPTILFVGTTPAIEPPPEAFDVYMQIDRRDVLTSSTDRVTSQTQDMEVVNLPAFEPSRSLRTLELQLGEQKNTLALRVRWSVPLATVATLGWGPCQISILWMVDRELR